jgi:hypothetical protein
VRSRGRSTRSREPKGAERRAGYLAGVSEESHRDAMNSAIRAQRERGNVPRSMLPPEDEPAPVPAVAEPMAPVAAENPEPVPEPEPAAKAGFFARLFGRP